MERSRRSVVGAVVPLVVLAALSGCSSGFEATSIKPYAPADGVQGDSGDLRVLNALVVAGEDGTTGTVIATVVNRGDRDDRLTEVTSPDATVALTGPGDLPPGSAATLGSGTTPAVSATELGKAAGENIELTFSFSDTEPITLRTVVVPATGYYADISPSLPATPPPSP